MSGTNLFLSEILPSVNGTLLLGLLLVTLVKVIRGACHGFVVQMIALLIVSNLGTLANVYYST
jgi:uncharacterized membrane protein SirB2